MTPSEATSGTERVRRWLLLTGNRHVVAAAIAVAVLLLLLALGYGGLVDFADEGGIRTAAGGTIPGLFTFLSIVLAINQLVLTQEFGSADEIRGRLDDIRAFRHDVEDMAGTAPSPVEPTGFLRLVVRTVGEAAAALEAAVAADGDEGEAALAAFAAAVQADVDDALNSLDQTDAGRINAILPVLQYPESRQLYEVRRLRSAHGDELSTETQAAVDGLVEALALFSVARTHFRTNYTQRVLARLSRLLLYVGVPGLVAAIVLSLAGVPEAVPAGLRIAAVSSLLTVALAPLAVLSSYILRVAAVSERTIAVGPFVSRPEPNDSETTRTRHSGDATTADERTAGDDGPSAGAGRSPDR
ncbi:hypothetical protein [Halomicrobium salinisoli]|uniref:hypothetical protein n=1 Tax=Halomicrobium salinisoli TaxID=2878391 RepID=UPI001CF07A3B|nr:hypothetical protein [Halomicrobium salinisoli]